MNSRKLALLAGALLLSTSLPFGGAVAQPAEQLVEVPVSRLQRLYLAPGADLTQVTAVILDTPQISFRDNWVRDFNATARGGRLTDQRAEQIRTEVSAGMGAIFTNAFRNGGFDVVEAPAPGVVRIQTHLVDLAITAPTVQGAGRTRTFAATAGEATLVVEVRDARTNALIARALDGRIAGQSRLALRNSVTNRSDFRRMFETWGRSSVDDFRALQAASAGEASGRP